MNAITCEIDMGYKSEVFTFVDTSHLVSRASLWEERDQAIAKGLEKLSNATVDKVAVDKDAKFGRKGKNEVLVRVQETYAS